MRLHTLPGRNLRFHWRTNVATVLGVVAGTAALTGALLVGDSMRASLREAALGRLGCVTHALVTTRHFREGLSDDLAAAPDIADGFDHVCPAVLLRGGVTHAGSRARVEHIDVLRVDERFAALDGAGQLADISATSGRVVVLNERLAGELGAQPGDDVLLRYVRNAWGCD